MDRLKDEKFAEFYKKYLGAVSENCELILQERKKDIGLAIKFLTSKVYIFYFIFIVSGVINKQLFLVFIGIFLSIFSFIYNFIILNNNFKHFLKINLFPDLLKNLNYIKWLENENINYLPDYNEFENSGLFLSINRRIVDDKFQGEYKGVKFKIYEIVIADKYIQAHSTYYKGKYSSNLFEGVVLLYKFNKKILNNTIVSTRKVQLKKDGCLKVVINILCVSLLILSIPLFTYFSVAGFKFDFSTIKSIFSPMVIFSSLLYFFIFSFLLRTFEYFKAVKQEDKVCLKPVTLEDSKFNKKFNVYSSDQVEARYLVTPLFMEKFYNLKTVFGAKNIRCSFFDDNLMIAIETKRDLFELGNLFKPVKDIKTIERFYDEITTIFEMIDYFKLNEDMYLK